MNDLTFGHELMNDIDRHRGELAAFADEGTVAARLLSHTEVKSVGEESDGTKREMWLAVNEIEVRLTVGDLDDRAHMMLAADDFEGDGLTSMNSMVEGRVTASLNHHTARVIANAIIDTGVISDWSFMTKTEDQEQEQ